MDFAQQLYQHLSNALPELTTRRFSFYCGKSEGYYGSICAQQLPISTNALIHLAEILEQLIAIKHTAQPITAQKLRKAQELIADEIASRAHSMSIDNLSVRKMIVGAVARTAYRHDHQHNMPAIILG